MSIHSFLKMDKLVKIVITSCFVSLLTACSLPEPEPLETSADKETEYSQKWSGNSNGIRTAPVRRIKLPQGALKVQSVKTQIPESILNKEVFLTNIPSRSRDIDGLLQLVTAQYSENIVVQKDSILEKKIPFSKYKGDLRGLFSILYNTSGVVSWYENGIIYLSDEDRYAFSIPQYKDIVDQLATEIEGLGAGDVIASLHAGQIIYTATPNLQKNTIEPYIERISKNMALVSLQLAVVSLSINDTTATGFDWSSFNLEFDGTRGTVADYPDISVDGGVSDQGYSGSVTGSGISLGAQKLLDVLGTPMVFNVSSAINFLSTFGNTDTLQDVEIKTLSGVGVKIRSGRKIPYITDVSVNSNNSDNLLGSADTDEVETGLTVETTPFYDSATGVATVDLSVEINQLLEFRELSAGNQIGSLSQPVTQDQTLTNIVRTVAGNTIILGGLQQEENAYTGNEPVALRNLDLNTGRRSQNISRNALFIILRPTVTLFVEENYTDENISGGYNGEFSSYGEAIPQENQGSNVKFMKGSENKLINSPIFIQKTDTIDKLLKSVAFGMNVDFKVIGDESKIRSDRIELNSPGKSFETIIYELNKSYPYGIILFDDINKTLILKVLE